jgi:hypothetical protein
MSKMIAAASRPTVINLATRMTKYQPGLIPV